MWLIRLGQFALGMNYVYRIALGAVVVAGLIKKQALKRG